MLICYVLIECPLSNFVGSAIRQIQEKNAYKTSMLIHCDTYKDEHSHEQRLVNKILRTWQSHFNNATLSAEKPLIDNAYKDFVNSINAGIANGELSKVGIPSLNDVEKRLAKMFSSTEYTVKCVNGDTTMDPNMYTKEGQLKLTNLLNIFIGGYKADRGITIEHMISFMYGRRPKQGGAANTLLQHMRQFGNRSKEDMSVTRFHTTEILHRQLTSIHHTDESLRDFFASNAAPSIISIDFDPSSGYRLCSPAQVRMSDMYGYKPFGRIIATGGMQTKRGIAKEISKIQSELQALEPNVVTPFKVTKEMAMNWIRRIKSTFEYNKKGTDNEGIDWDEEIMIGAIEKYCYTQDETIWCYYKLDQSRRRKDDATHFANDPDVGIVDRPIALKYATDRPILMLIGETGDKGLGWNGDPFFWPVLRLPTNAKNCIFCHGVNGAVRKASSKISVTFADGTVISKNKAYETMIDCINKIGASKVESLGIKYRSNNLIYSAGRQPKDYYTITRGKYYLRKNIGVDKVVELLTDVSNKLSLGLKILTI